jgi:hypothetical protein
LTWEVKPWGLFMTYPMKDGRNNPADDPCVKPNLDSSGGFGDRWFMNHMTIKTPSEHTINGTRYDAEINFAHFQYRRRENLALIISVLVDASEEYPDNPIFEPYVQKFLDLQEDVESECVTSAPTASAAPSSTPLPFIEKELSTPIDDDSKVNGFNGIMFDVQSSSEKALGIDSLSFKLFRDDGDDGAYQFEVYSKEGTHVGDVRKAERWTSLGQYVSVGTGDEDEAQMITLTQPVNVPAGERVALYIIHVDRREQHLQVGEMSRNDRGTEQTSNDDISIIVGTATNGGAFERNQMKRGTSFLGTIYYTAESDIASVMETNTTATETNATVMETNATTLEVRKRRFFQKLIANLFIVYKNHHFLSIISAGS